MQELSIQTELHRKSLDRRALKGNETQEEQAAYARIRRARVQRPKRSNTLKVALESEATGSVQNSNGLEVRGRRTREGTPRRDTAVVTRYGCKREKFFEGSDA